MAQTSRWAASKPIGQGLRVQVKRLAAESEMLPLLAGICKWVALCFVCFSWVVALIWLLVMYRRRTSTKEE